MRLARLTVPIVLPALLVSMGTAAAADSATRDPMVATIPRVLFRDLGHAPNTPVRLAIALKYRNAGDLEALADGRSEFFHGQRVLSADEFRNYFAPSAFDYRRTASTFAGLGFRVVQMYANRTVLDVEAPPAVVDRAFATDIHAVFQPEVAPAGGRAGIPGGLRYAISGRQRYRPRSLPDAGFPAIGPPLLGPDGGFGPFAFVTAYNFPVQHQVRGGKPGQTYDGIGQATANVMDSDFQDSDLAGFLSYFNIVRTGPPIKRILIDGGPMPRINEDQIETDLDVETIVGTTPGTALYLYLWPENLGDSGVLDAYNQLVSDDAVGAVNSSFTQCENGNRGYATTTDHIAMQGVALGIRFSASTGDDGSSCPGGRGVGSPVSGPHFIATGGTTLSVHADGSYGSEAAWVGSGGGVSEVFSKPPYQDGIQNVIGNTRNIPDIAFDANPATGASLYMNGRFVGPVGGTSLASPLTTALFTQLDQFNGSRLGDVHGLLYAGFKKLGYDAFDGMPAFRDITVGGNGMYRCLKGYDLVTGIGSMDGAGAANAYKPG